MFIERQADCWKCGRGINVYTWPGHEMWANTCPGEGRPATVRLMHSGTAEGEYWANSCSYCGAIQGDWFLYMEPDGAFFGMEGEAEESSQGIL